MIRVLAKKEIPGMYSNYRPEALARSLVSPLARIIRENKPSGTPVAWIRAG
jgi:hypothetical protein